MPETEAQRRAREMRSADRAAGTMFNLFPQGTFQSLGQAFQRSFSNPQSGTMMAGSAGVNPMMAGNIPDFPRLGPLIRTGSPSIPNRFASSIISAFSGPPPEAREYRNPADQWDARPVRTAPQKPQFVGTDPRAATPDDMDYFYGRGKYAANQPAKQTVAATAPQPAKSAAKPTATIQTPYGTVKATADQLQYDSAFKDNGQSFWAAGTMVPQSARLANIGERARGMGMARRGGQKIAENYRTTMTNFANRNISSPVDLPAPQGRFGQALVSNFPSSREAMARAEQAVSPTSPLASMGNAPSFPFMEERNRNPFSSIYGFQS